MSLIDHLVELGCTLEWAQNRNYVWKYIPSYLSGFSHAILLFKNRNGENMIRWCEENLGHRGKDWKYIDYPNIYPKIYFKTEEQLFLFKLTFDN